MAPSTAEHIQNVVIILNDNDAKDYKLDGDYRSNTTPHFNITLQVFQLFFSQVSFVVLRYPFLCEIVSHIEECSDRNYKHQCSAEDDLVLH